MNSTNLKEAMHLEIIYVEQNQIFSKAASKHQIMF
jgi:hypothetical protein